MEVDERISNESVSLEAKLDDTGVELRGGRGGGGGEAGASSEEEREDKMAVAAGTGGPRGGGQVHAFVEGEGKGGGG